MIVIYTFYILCIYLLCKRENDTQRLTPCPKDSPIQDKSHFDIRFGKDGEQGVFFAIQITSFKNGIVETTYKGKTFSGVVAEWLYPIPMPAKGGSFEKQILSVKKDQEKKRRIELEKLGLLQMREAAATCLTKPSVEDHCLGNYLPSGANKFSLDMPDSGGEFDAKGVRVKLASDANFRKSFSSCLNFPVPKIQGEGDKKKEITLFPDDEPEYSSRSFYWGCKFQWVQGKWIFIGMDWYGC